MSPIATLIELFRYNDWARDRVLGIADGLSDAELDQVFEMGSGTVRETLRHIYGAERIWHERVSWTEPGSLPDAKALRSTAELRSAFYALADERDQRLQASDLSELGRIAMFRRLDGASLSCRVDIILMHVANHGVYHRAQLLNMFRRLGAPLPNVGIDYILMRHEMAAAGAAAPVLSADVLRTLFSYADWARERVHALAMPLDDAALDRPFEMGAGSLRKTLAHIAAVEAWWLSNWTRGPGAALALPGDGAPVAEIARHFGETAAARGAILASLDDSGLMREVVGAPRPGLEFRFPIGVTMVQLVNHGTHHRAQALNMLRRVGVSVPSIDLFTWWREMSGQ